MGKRLRRGAGILMPVSSLPSPYGIGTFGKEAYEFVDFLKSCNHRYWQVLPLGPTSFGDSPYQSFSTFAGNPYFIDLQMLIDEGLLEKDYVESFDWGSEEDKTDYAKIFSSRFTVLREAFKNSNIEEVEDYVEFCDKNREWLDDYCLYMACKWYFDNQEWLLWNEEIKFRKPEGIAKYQELLAEDIRFNRFLQYMFYKQWNALKEYANKAGIEIIGDIPIYVALDSADVWVHTGLFLLDEDLRPTLVAGVPPDAFTDLGQKWGNPLYDWETMEKDGFSWWRSRMKAASDMYDIVRIDHFLGIVKYYTIPADNPDAKEGEYRMGPGKKLTDAINEAIGDKKIIAEDLGVSLPEATALLEANGYPGMKILEFAFDGSRDNPHLPFNYTTPNCVVYGGTHDNETLAGFFEDRNDWELAYAYDYLDTKDRSELVEKVFRAGYSSIADVVIFQTQDILALDNAARMNFPSTLGDNWQWRMKKGELTEKHLNDLRYLASVFGR